jgi:TPR repeat protein
LPADIPKQNSAPASSVSQQPASDSATPEKSVPENPAEGEVKPAGTEPDNSGTAAAGTTDAGKSGTSSAEKAGNAEPEAAAVAAAPAMKVSATGQKEFEEARKILHGEHRTREMEKAVEFLLASVSRGHVRAEVTLGDLYARGDGVPRDCGQARILLEAAVKKGSPEARRLLGKLKSQGCP